MDQLDKYIDSLIAEHSRVCGEILRLETLARTSRQRKPARQRKVSGGKGLSGLGGARVSRRSSGRP